MSEAFAWLLAKPIAHRGLHSAGAPENSLPAFQAAIERELPVELDVQLTRDGVPVVFHDATLARMTGVEGDVRELEWDQLRNLRLVGTQFRIPRIEEVLDLAEGRVGILIELKRSSRMRSVEWKLLENLREYQGAVALQSFNPISVRRLKRRQNQWPVGQLVRFGPGPHRSDELMQWLITRAMCWATQPDFIAQEHTDLAAGRLLFRERNPGRPILAWTVTSPEEERAARRYADNVIFEGYDPVVE